MSGLRIDTALPQLLGHKPDGAVTAACSEGSEDGVVRGGEEGEEGSSPSGDTHHPAQNYSMAKCLLGTEILGSRMGRPLAGTGLLN